MSNPMTLEERVLTIKGDPAAIEALMREYDPLVRSLVSKRTGKPIADGMDEYNLALMAFVEALERFDPDRGPFLVFLKLVIYSRLAQYHRSLSKEAGVISVDFSSPSPEILKAQNQASQTGHALQEDQAALQEEIENFKKELGAWHLTLQDIVAHSPRLKRLREDYMSSARIIMDHPLLLEELLTKKRLPIEKIRKYQKIPQKTLERGRIYIIGLVIILTGDYDRLQSYIDWRWQR
jgi:RNA polymerase sigma factor